MMGSNWQIHGRRGVTDVSFKALEALLNERTITKAVMTVSKDGDNEPEGGSTVLAHGFILVEDTDRTWIVADGFASGYSGSGPHGLMRAMRLLDRRGIRVFEAVLDTKTHNAIYDGLEDVSIFVDSAMSLEVHWEPDALGPVTSWKPGHLIVRDHKLAAWEKLEMEARGEAP